jgi:hypothetical protein
MSFGFADVGFSETVVGFTFSFVDVGEGIVVTG